jgi:hypothetical protein
LCDSDEDDREKEKRLSVKKGNCIDSSDFHLDLSGGKPGRGKCPKYYSVWGDVKSIGHSLILNYDPFYFRRLRGLCPENPGFSPENPGFSPENPGLRPNKNIL